MKEPTCQHCGANNPRVYERYVFTTVGVPTEPEQLHLCVKCVRRERQAYRYARAVQSATSDSSPENQITREELIAAMDRFWDESGAGEICRRCHEQGTGCCPPMCRHLSVSGCLKKNVFCTSFVCSALLNAIAECDPYTGRLLKWMKSHPGSAEFRIYEMVTRVPAIDREPTRPLTFPDHYPGPLKLSGNSIRPHLATLTEEVLEIRRCWHHEEQSLVKIVPK